jgi:crotonobetainyl-CoA:carnitine CoA-transferase CaiB-like acyl-CoA transferase
MHMTEVKGPLHGIRVIDLGPHQAGSRCAQVLARLGAEVIKIKRLGGRKPAIMPLGAQTERLLGAVQQRQKEPELGDWDQYDEVPG